MAWPPNPSGGIHRPERARKLRQRELTRVRSINELALPSRATNALLRGGANSVGQLISRSREDLMTEIIGLGEGTLKTIETALSQEDLTLAPAKIPSSAFTQTTPRRALARAKTNRHIKNHYAWISSAVDSRDCLNNGGSTVGLTRRALPGGED
ncbi:DNA-directed RNA polymerase subunit alpha C-terminal domain-containing protein [Arthrobacter liuii]|nr:DNA-directed RNA polymerase subunit alpha C-terminal domain-containing protein [Arthrobacter liuii]